MAVSKALRFEILRRDNHTCRYCGATAPDAVLQIDHVVPTTLGGDDAPANLVTACRDCNSGKRATPPGAPLVADVAQDALRWRAAMEIARDTAMRDHQALEVWCDMFDDRWSDFTVITPSYKGGSGLPEPIRLPCDWRTTVMALAADGMYPAEMRDAINVAMARNPDDYFAYFVGVVRNKIRERQAVARDLIDRGEV